MNAPRFISIFVTVSLYALFFASCNEGKRGGTDLQEDQNAKKMMQGAWFDELEENVVFSVKGDTIFYTDSTSQPVAFSIIGDSLCLNGSVTTKYPIVKLTNSLLVFINQNGDEVRLTKDENLSLHMRERMEMSKPVVINQRRVIKNDTVVMLANVRNHLYVQVNPTTYRVIKTNYNGEGVRVDNVYYDNTVSICIVKNGVKTFIHDFYKKEFAGVITAGIISQSILNDIVYEHHDEKGFHFYAQVGIPDTPSNYMAKIIVTDDNKYTISKVTD
ncbi:MAG: DUF4738 domain-containing protein [Prevotella sp.]|uniref:DUF4738 domain-containing protein n=1 Tax=Prevotella sp. TaxID=59823 RepID=UPI002A2A7B2C|nr:DUF4738 domain-containing protein [Prevotella sp.]MDD7318067.1 DUF4738 domain-containing protein [Prevotellaceae bacterium]MDY4021044.1 DUF4738 domain-containing protein [Prevotella sp.]